MGGVKRLRYLPDSAVLITIQRARKTHHCEAESSSSGCTGRLYGIRPGEIYARATVTPRHDVAGGHWGSQCFCLPCAEWWGWLDAMTNGERQELAS